MTDYFEMGFQKGYLKGPCIIPVDWDGDKRRAYRAGHAAGKDCRIKMDHGPVSLSGRG
jgi:hypothetical protein